MLKPSRDRKTAVHISVPNAFGIPAGISCPGATNFCSRVCYAKKQERMPYLKSLRTLLTDNYNALKDASSDEMYLMLDTLIEQFVTQSNRRSIDKKFRIHWDGDFFSYEYAVAWARVIHKYPDVIFWAYTRSFDYVPALKGLDNLTLYLSVDENNKQQAIKCYRNNPWVKIAALADTFEQATGIMKLFDNRPGAKCPEQTGQLELIDENKQGACIRCDICVKGKANVRFATKRR